MGQKTIITLPVSGSEELTIPGKVKRFIISLFMDQQSD